MVNDTLIRVPIKLRDKLKEIRLTFIKQGILNINPSRFNPKIEIKTHFSLANIIDILIQYWEQID